MMTARKVLAFAIMATFTGLLTETAIPDGKWQRAPLTGAGMLAAVAVIAWAENELGAGPPGTMIQAGPRGRATGYAPTHPRDRNRGSDSR